MTGSNPDLIVQVAANITALQADMATAAATLKQLEDATKSSAAAAIDWSSVMDGATQLLSAFGVALTVEKLVAFTMAAIDFAASIEDLSRATGISTDALQQLAYVGQSFGLNLDMMARAVETLSSKLATGNASAVFAVRSLGLSVTDLIAAGPEEAFVRIGAAISQIPDPMERSALATDVWGRRLALTLLPGLADLRAKLNEVPKEAVISAENIAAAKEFDVTIAHLGTDLHAMWAGFVVGAFSTKQYDEQLARLGQAGKDASTSADGHFLSEVNVSSAMDTAASKAKELQDWLTSLRTAGMEPLSDDQKNLIVETEALGATHAQIAARLGITVEAILKYNQSLKDQKQAVTEAAAVEAQREKDKEAEIKAELAAFQAAKKIEESQYAELESVTDAYYKLVNAGSHDSYQAQITDAYLAADAKVAALQKSTKYSLDAEMMIWAAADQTVSNITQKLLEADPTTKEHYQLIADQAKAAYDFADAHAASYTTAELQRLRDVADAARITSESWSAGMVTAAATVSAAVNSAVAVTLGGFEQITMASAAASIAAGASNMFPDTIEGRLAMLAYTQSQSVTPINISSLFAGLPAAQTRDAGGPVSAGQPYLIGTGAQPELFVPSSAGTMLPNASGSGGGGSTTVNLVVDRRVLASIVLDTITGTVKQSRLLPSV